MKSKIAFHPKSNIFKFPSPSLSANIFFGVTLLKYFFFNIDSFMKVILFENRKNQLFAFNGFGVASKDSIVECLYLI